MVVVVVVVKEEKEERKRGVVIRSEGVRVLPGCKDQRSSTLQLGSVGYHHSEYGFVWV